MKTSKSTSGPAQITPLAVTDSLSSGAISLGNKRSGELVRTASKKHFNATFLTSLLRSLAAVAI
jgi:hypothetical protein